MKEYLFGAAYYDEYMPYDRIDEDMRMMKKAGFNVIRIAESTWSTLEPKPDVFDFTHIDRMLSAAEKYGLYVIVGTPTYAVPPWLYKLDNNVLVPGAAYGTRQNMDITNKTYLHHAQKAIRKLLEHTANHPSVIGFQLDNETHHYFTTSESAQKLFKQYLIEKFETPENMNKAFGLAYWSNSIADWDDFPDISQPQNGSMAVAFEMFRQKLAADFIKWQGEIVREYKKPHQFITHNLDFDWEFFGPAGHHDGASRGLRSDTDHFAHDSALDITGVDVYHKTQKHLDGMAISFAGSEMYALKNKQYIVLETQAQAFNEYTPFPGQMKLHAIAHLASGACGVMYWNWHSIHNGRETYWKGVLSHDFAENPTYLEICEIGKELKELAPALNGLVKKNRVALLVDNLSNNAIKSFPIHKDLLYNDVILKYYKALYEMNVECDIVFTQSLDIDKYDLVIAPALYCADERITSALKNYVKHGGVLFSGFKSFVSDTNVKVSHKPLPSDMTDVFGVTYNQSTRPEDVTVNNVPAEYFMELLNVTAASPVYFYEHSVWKKYCAFSENNYGSGKAFYLGYVPSDSQLKELFSYVLEKAGIAVCEASFPIIVKEGYAGGKKVTFVLNFAQSESEYTAKCAAKELRTKESFKKGEKITLEPWGAKILIEE